MQEKTIIIPGEMPGMNEIIAAAKSHYHQYNDMKKVNTEMVTWVAKKYLRRRKYFWT